MAHSFTHRILVREPWKWVLSQIDHFFLGALLTSGLLLTVRRQWNYVFRASLRIHAFGIISGLFHYGGNIIHTIGTTALSPVISWPLGVTMGLWTQFWGLVYGEFKGASRRAEPRVNADFMAPSTLLPVGTGSSLGSRPANVAAFASASVRDEPPVSLGPLMSAARGAD